jgi:fucose permease
VDGDGVRERAQVLLAYALFVAIGVAAGVSGVLLLAQIRDYGVDQATIGLTFFTGSAGFVLAGASSGGLMHRYGTRAALLVAGSGYVLAALYIATRPPFVALVLIQLLTGYATGVLESVLNAHLTTLAKATTRLNRLHAFFGVGALVGPVLASWMLGFTTWPMVWLVIAAIYAPLTAAVIFAYPQRTEVPTSEKGERGLLSTALRDRAILLGAVMLAVYVGLELGVGNWAYSYLVEARSLGGVAAGYTVSGYWLGLTLGRFLISPVAGRLGLTAAGQMYLCLVGVTAAAALTWLAPVAAGASVGFVALGFFLGPIFPTTMAVGSQLTVASLVPTAIGVMNAGSVVGGSALPWLAGALGQGVGPWTLLPFALVLALLQLAVWWRIARRIRPATHVSTVDTHAAHPEPS